MHHNTYVNITIIALGSFLYGTTCVALHFERVDDAGSLPHFPT